MGVFDLYPSNPSTLIPKFATLNLVAAKRFVHHFVPHTHYDEGEPASESTESLHHRGHALENRALFAYLLIFAITVSGFWLIRTKAPQILGTASYSAAQIIALTNVKRAENGLPAFSENTKLDNAAQGKSQDMFANNYWAHFSPQGKSPWNFITGAGYHYIYAGENLARDFNDAQSVVNAWMASPSHRSNILDKNFKEIGVTVADGKLDGREGVLVVQMFGAGISQAPTQFAGPASPTPAPSSPSSKPLAQLEEGKPPASAETPTTSPSPSPTATPEVGIVAQNFEQAPAPPETAATVLASRQFSISKIISLILVGSIFLLFVLEVAVAGKKRDLQIKSSTLAHLGILALTLFAVWYAVAGAVI